MTRNVSGTGECLPKFPAKVTSSLLEEEGGRERRQRVCRSWTGYGTVVSDRAVLLPQQQQGGGFSLRNTIRRATSLVIATPRIDVRLMPSLKSLVSRRSMGGSSSSTVLPLMKKESSCSEIPGSEDGMRKCETMLALSSYGMSSSRTALQVEPLRPVNRLRVPPTDGRMCSRCSSLLSMASSSRYSLNTAGGGFVPSSSHQEVMLCKLCLGEVPLSSTCDIAQCGCAFCKDCMKSYVEFEIQEGAYDISCPDAQCKKQGVISQEEIANLVSSELVEKHNKFRLNREVDMDVSRTWCPRAGCETVCSLCGPVERCLPQSVHCPTCSSDFCSNCKNPWHAGSTCEENSRHLAKEDSGIPFDSDLIKCCPMCNVPIEKDEGCAQMMCKRCKHVFCWYCLASLDDDFLLRHYDKGPCKNKLGHSRASVIWHRTQVIGIFAGFGILLLVASPLLLLAAPCIVCCKCRVCSGSSKLDEDEVAEESAS